MKSIMFQGTGSGVGKSLLTAGLCRILTRKGIKVAPFKSQNMSLNSGVVNGHLEMGRAQILQAEAAGIEPDVRMNPILLKPQKDTEAQLICMGKVHSVNSAKDYFSGISNDHFNVVADAYNSLAAEYDMIILEGAGSPAEINLQSRDIVNMRMAAHANADVYIVSDIDRGGVFAWMKGTYELIQKEYQPLVKGFVINQFRGDISLLEPGIDMFQSMVPVPVVGTLPFFHHHLEDEDGQSLPLYDRSHSKPILTIAVLRLPHISNFTDFTPLRQIRDIQLDYVMKPEQLDNADLIIIPGSKNTRNDLAYIKSSGLFDKLMSLRGETPVIGICGGYQMMGQQIEDPDGTEGTPGGSTGLGFFNMDTVITKEKCLTRKEYGGQHFLSNTSITGYEIHMGISSTNQAYTQLTELESLMIMDESQKMIGTYLHGIFESATVTTAILKELTGKTVNASEYAEQKEKDLNRLADLMEEHLDVDAMLSHNG